MPGWLRDAARGILLFVVLPNLVFFLVARFFYLDRPLINYDYIVLGAAWLWLPAWLRITAFAITFLADAITSTGSMYNISPVAGVVALFRAPYGLIITVVLAFAVACGIAAVLGAQINKAITGRAAAVTLGLTLAFALALATSDARSQTTKLAADITTRDRGYRTRPAKMPAATDDLRASIAAQNDNVAIIVVESWGVLADASAHQQLIDIFRTPVLQQRYAIRSGAIDFKGGTTSGELRELCGVFTDYLVLNQQTSNECLPVLLRRRGFGTVALHGYKPAYYSRNVWYPRFFDKMLFQDSLARTTRRCGTQFRGVCDREVFERFAAEVRAGQRQLTYWLTIDAHTPVDRDRLGELPTGGCAATEDVCLLIAFYRDLLQNLAALAGEPGLPPTRFIIVGDHAPAFVRQSRARHFVRGRVPWVELLPQADPARLSRVE